jgi:hypothetical protein
MDELQNYDEVPDEDLDRVVDIEIKHKLKNSSNIPFSPQRH